MNKVPFGLFLQMSFGRGFEACFERRPGKLREGLTGGKAQEAAAV
jgi:hypothetical protein